MSLAHEIYGNRALQLWFCDAGKVNYTENKHHDFSVALMCCITLWGHCSAQEERWDWEFSHKYLHYLSILTSWLAEWPARLTEWAPRRGITWWQRLPSATRSSWICSCYVFPITRPSLVPSHCLPPRPSTPRHYHPIFIFLSSAFYLYIFTAPHIVWFPPSKLASSNQLLPYK